jgi:hypothetical protein
LHYREASLWARECEQNSIGKSFQSSALKSLQAAGLAKDVDAVNQYAAPIYAATMAATRDAGARRMTSKSPAVATVSAIHWPVPDRILVDH